MPQNAVVLGRKLRRTARQPRVGGRSAALSAIVSGLGLTSGSTDGTDWVLVLVKLPPFVAGFEKAATLNRQIGGDFEYPGRVRQGRGGSDHGEQTMTDPHPSSPAMIASPLGENVRELTAAARVARS